MVRLHGMRKLALLLLGPAAALVAVVAIAPLTVVLGASRLVVSAVLATGAWISIRRLGSVDLGTAAAALAGAAIGGVVPALWGVPVVLGILPAAVAGAAVSGTVVAVGARVGRGPSALTSLAVAIGAVALASSWDAAGGRAGFHAVPLITGSDRGDLLVALGVLAAALAAVGIWASRRPAASATVSVRAAHVAAALGDRPVLAAARGGMVAGAVLGVGGWLQVSATGSMIPGGYGLGLSASLALAALVGGRSVLSGSVGALVVFGPAVIWPTAPVVGEASVLVVGVLGLALLAVRPEGLLRAPRSDPHAAPSDPASGPATGPDADPASGPAPGPDTDPADGAGADLLAPDDPAALTVGETSVPGGQVSLRVEPGQIVAVLGPNGSGKSTLLARIAGQLSDEGVVRIGGSVAPAGAVARARRGLARTWQHPPDVRAEDGLLVAARTARDRDAAGTVRELLGEHAATPAGRDLVRLAARRPAVAVLDEPGAALPAEAVARVLRALAEAGAAVLVADHRRELADLADRTVELGRGRSGGPVRPRVAVPAVAGGGAPLSIEVTDERMTVPPGEVQVLEGAVAQRVVGAVLGVPGSDRALVRIGGRRLRRGRRLPRGDLASVVRRGLGIVTDTSPPADVSVRDHLAAIAGVAEADRLLSGPPLLSGRGDDPTGVLSGGERRMLSWLVCLAVRPDAVLLDRSTAGLDTDAQAWTADVVTAWRDAGVPVLVRPGRPEERRWASRRRDPA